VLHRLALLGTIAAVAIFSPAARADNFLLTNDGQVTGELLNRDEWPRQKFVIRTADGATITLEKAQVKQVVTQSAAELEYEKIAPTFADTVEDQWRLAEWCREKSLPRGRQIALGRVIELNPDHKQARIALGYSQLDGQWIQPDEARKKRGFVNYHGDWLLPQEIELLEKKHADDLAEKKWFTTLKQWRNWLDDPAKADQARDNIKQITDPTAVRALVQSLDTEKTRDVCVWYIQALGKIGPAAVRTLVEHSLDDPDEEIRLSCLDQLIGQPTQAATPLYVNALRNKDNVQVNRAGYALGRLGDKSAIAPLIDALITTHKFTTVEGAGNPNQMSAGFSNKGGGGLSMGSTQKVYKRDLNNQQVLDALVALTGANLGFDKTAWKNWYSSQQKPGAIDARRD
jgi:HEAT repeats/PBS lyase HEAT-like repeat